MFWWWLPFMPMLGPVEAGNDVSGSAVADRRKHAKTKVKGGYGDTGDQPRRKTKANIRRKAARKTTRRIAATRKPARKTRSKGRR